MRLAGAWHISFKSKFKLQTSKFKNNSQSPVPPSKIQNPKSKIQNPQTVWLENVDGLLAETKSLHSLLGHSLTSFVGNVGNVGRYFSSTENLSLNLPTVSALVLEAQSQKPTSFNTHPTQLQQNVNEVRSQSSGVSRQELEVRSQSSGVSRQESEVRSQESEVTSQKFCPVSSPRRSFCQAPVAARGASRLRNRSDTTSSIY